MSVRADLAAARREYHVSGLSSGWKQHQRSHNFVLVVNKIAWKHKEGIQYDRENGIESWQQHTAYPKLRV